jgi:hypothetical protein
MHFSDNLSSRAGDTLSQTSDATLEGGGPASEGESPDTSLREWNEPRMRKQVPNVAVPRIGVSLGGNVLAEMKALQEKRASAMFSSRHVCFFAHLLFSLVLFFSLN